MPLCTYILLNEMPLCTYILLNEMPLCTAAIASDKLKDDKDFCMKLLNEVLKVDCEEKDLKCIFRIWKKMERKDRPCLVEFRDSLIKNAVMESLSNLANADEKYKKLSVAHDMTKLEREDLKKLLAEAKVKESDTGQGEWMFRVRGTPGNLRIVRLKKNYVQTK